MIKADVLIANKRWKKYIRTPGQYINNKLKKINKKTNLFKKNSCNFTLLLSEGVEIKKLNLRYRKKNRTTDILSFPFHEKAFLKKLFKKKKNKIYLGDIIINLNKIVKKTKNESFKLSFDKIWIHGLTHLLGYRHKSNLDFSVMNKIEAKLFEIIK